MHVLDIAKAIKKMTVRELKDLIFENYHQTMRFSKEDSYYSMKHQKKKDLQFFVTKLTEKISDPHDPKEHYQSFLSKKT